MKAEGNVEVWLMSLMNMAQKSLHGVIRTAAMAIQDQNFQLLEFLSMFPAQVSYLPLSCSCSRGFEKNIPLYIYVNLGKIGFSEYMYFKLW